MPHAFLSARPHLSLHPLRLVPRHCRAADGDALSFTGTVDVRGIMVSLMRGGKGSKSAGSALLDTQESAILTPRANARTSIELREANSSAELRDANGSVDSCSTPGFATVLSADEHDAILSHPSGVGVPQRPGKSLMEEVSVPASPLTS